MEIEFDFPVLMFKSRSFVDFIYRIGRKREKIIKKLGTFALFLSLLGSVVAIDFLVRGAAEVLRGGPAQVSILIPGVQIPGSAFRLPLLEGLVVIFLLAIFHEGFHGIVASAHGLKPKYFAFLLFLFIPAAGVEIDEEKLKKVRKVERLRIFAAGSFGNLVLALICIILAFPLGKVLETGIEPKGLLVLNVTNPQINLKPGYVIEEINGTDVRNLENLWKFMEKIKPGEYVEIKTRNGTFIGKTIESEGKARLGIYLRPLIEYRSAWARALAFVVRVLLLSFQINIGVALINLLPVHLLDGGRILEDMAPGVLRFVSPLMLLLLILNIAGPYLPL